MGRIRNERRGEGGRRGLERLREERCGEEQRGGEGSVEIQCCPPYNYIQFAEEFVCPSIMHECDEKAPERRGREIVKGGEGTEQGE